MAQQVDKAQSHRIGVLLGFGLYLATVFMVVVLPVLLEMDWIHRHPYTHRHFVEAPWLGPLLRVDGWVCFHGFHHRWAAGFLVLAGFYGLCRWAGWARRRRNRRYLERATGVEDDREALRFRTTKVDLFEQVKRRPRGCTFVGMTPVKRRALPGYAWKPVYLSETERDMHRHVLGKTGSGKTSSIVWPQALQDALDGKGQLVMDAKGSDENARMMKAIAKRAGRVSQMRHFSLAAWSNPHVFSHAYNMLQVALRSPKSSARGDARAHGGGARDDGGGDVHLMCERVFPVLGLSDEPYYRAQAQLAFFRLCRLLHGMVGTSGWGYPFNMMDLAVVLRGLVTGARDDAWGKALRWCLKESKERHVAEELDAQLAAKGAKLEEDLAGLVAAVEKFQSPIVNAYAPDFTFEDALESNLLVYVQLPSNLYPLQAPAIGKVMLADVQQQTAHRQVSRRHRKQTPFSVSVDEFGTFAGMNVVDSLNKARDAHVQYTASHQSFADLDRVDPHLAQAVWDNTRTKDLLHQDDKELCERYAASIGTYPHLEHTVQQAPDGAGGIEPTGVMSVKAVEKFILHPNQLRALCAPGHGFVFVTRASGRRALPVVYGQMPDISSEGDYELPRNDQSKARGLRLKEKYLDARPANVVPLRTAAKPDAPAEAPELAPRARPVADARPPRHFARDTVAMPPPPPPETREGADDDVEDASAPAPSSGADSETRQDDDVNRRPTVAMQRLKRKVSNG